jgi:amino acid adenylation domain-containing protein
LTTTTTPQRHNSNANNANASNSKANSSNNSNASNDNPGGSTVVTTTLRRIAAEHAGRTALIAGPRQVSYAELGELVGAAARRLSAVAQDRVVVVSERSPETVATFLACLSLGILYLPVDPALMAGRLESAVQRFGATIVDWTAELRAEGDTWPQVDLTPDTPAYAILTSGSTGVPRAATISHANLAAYLERAVDMFALTAQDRVLQVASFGFDWSVSEMFPALAAGACVVLRSPAALDSAEHFIDELERFAITTVQLPTAAWNALLPGLLSEGTVLPSRLRQVTIGGEQATLEAVRAWHKRYGGGRVRLVNSYGPTECTVEVTHLGLSGPSSIDITSRQAVPIGLPWPGIEIHVLDSGLRPVPDGEQGTMFISGWAVGLGYLDDPDGTAERFRSDAWRGGAARMYDTGDIGRRNQFGELEFLGRADNQIKIGGYRVELEEIERLIAAHQAVREVSVVPRKETSTLAAFVVTSGAFDPDELRSWLAGRTMSHFVPSRIVQVAKLPRTVNDKVDKRALAALLDDAPASGPTDAVSEVERLIAEVWRSALGLSQISIDDDFFQLGGYSLLAVRIVGQLNKRGLPVRPRDIADARSVRGLAGLLASRA